MTDHMIPADEVRDIIARHRDGASDRGGMILDDLKALLGPTLADMTEEERAQHITGQVDVNTATFAGRGILVGFDALSRVTLKNAHAMILTRDWQSIVVNPKDVTPRPDLPRLEWPGDTPTPTPATLTEGSEWGDIDALTLACETSGRDQIVVADCEDDVFVWGADAGWWETGVPSDGYEPFTVIHAGKKADQ